MFVDLLKQVEHYQGAVIAKMLTDYSDKLGVLSLILNGY